MIRRPPRSTLFPYTNALPIWLWALRFRQGLDVGVRFGRCTHLLQEVGDDLAPELHLRSLRSVARVEVAVEASLRSEEHTSELQSQSNLVCRLLLEKKNNALDRMRTRLPSSHGYLSSAVFC